MPNGNVGTFKRVLDMTTTFTEYAEQYANVGLKPQALRRLYEKQKLDKLYLSEYYQVAIDKDPPHTYTGMKIWHLSIKRLDKEPIMDWRDLQAIKNQLCGLTVEAIQLYPSEVRLVDTSNQYHLFAFMPNKKGECPIIGVGWMVRSVTDNDGSDGAYVSGAKQRPLPKDEDDQPRPVGLDGRTDRVP